MATRYGRTTLEWLQERGWEIDPAPHPEGWVGDPKVVDPETGESLSVYEAANRQRERTGEYPDFLGEGK